ncbi:serine hydrolase domain-containing protein [Chitinophagaceae bacterium LWZ2-11]
MRKTFLSILSSIFLGSIYCQPVMTETEKLTDNMAQLAIKYMNAKKFDSAYTLMGEAFQKEISLEKWNTINQTQLKSLFPVKKMEFVGSKKNINKYKVESAVSLQLFVSLDDKKKIEVFLLQPYKDEDEKKKEPAATDNPKHSALDQVVSAVISDYIQVKDNVGVSVGIYFKGADYFYNYGETAKKNNELPTMNTLYEIGSISKTFTATLLAKAVVNGKAKLKDPIVKYLPDSVASNPSLKQITLEELANHTSGLPRLPADLGAVATDPNQPYANYDDKKLFSFLKNFTAICKPGTLYEYSNLAVGLLGVILERIYNAPYEQLIVQYIDGPLELPSIKITLTDDEKKLLTQGYSEDNKAAPGWVFGSFKAAGALKSNTKDLLQYGKQQLSSAKNPLSKAIELTHAPTFSDGKNKVGLGWHYAVGDSDKIIEHNGGTAGFRSVICVNRTTGTVVVVLTNNASTGDALGIKLMHAAGKLN